MSISTWYIVSLFIFFFITKNQCNYISVIIGLQDTFLEMAIIPNCHQASGNTQDLPFWVCVQQQQQ